MTPSSRNPERSVGFLLQDVSRLLRRNFNRRVQDLGLTQAQWQAIARLWQNEGISQAGLADLLEVQPITLARLIDRMQATGWVERRPDPDDRRAVRLYLTPRVEPIISEMWEAAARTRQLAMAGLPEDRREALIEILSHMKQNLLAAADKPDGAFSRKIKEDA